MSNVLIAAERVGLASKLLDVQRECVELRRGLRECQRALAMMVEPRDVAQTTVFNAYVACVTAETKARRILGERATKFDRCEDCNGSGLALNAAGEPDECRACRGNTVIPAEGRVA